MSRPDPRSFLDELRKLSYAIPPGVTGKLPPQAKGALIGGATGMGLGAMRQAGRIYAGEQDRLNPVDLATSGMVGAGLGYGAGKVAPHFQAAGQHLHNLGNEAYETMKVVRESVPGVAQKGEDALGSVKETLDYIRSKPFINLGD